MGTWLDLDQGNQTLIYRSRLQSSAVVEMGRPLMILIHDTLLHLVAYHFNVVTGCESFILPASVWKEIKWHQLPLKSNSHSRGPAYPIDVVKRRMSDLFFFKGRFCFRRSSRVTMWWYFIYSTWKEIPLTAVLKKLCSPASPAFPQSPLINCSYIHVCQANTQ